MNPSNPSNPMNTFTARPGNLLRYLPYIPANSNINRYQVVRDPKMIAQFNSDEKYCPYTPIYLDDYWIGRLGFDLNGDFFKLPGFRIFKDFREYWYLDNLHQLRCVHEVQNLYWQRHGKELPVQGFR